MAYQTSALYKEAIDKECRVTFIDGTLTTAKGTVINIANDVIDQGSCYITNQCVNGDAFSLGSVFSAEAGITLKTEIDRYSLYDASIKLYFNILLSNNEYERIPLGVFYVNDPKRVGKHISIKAYDKMIYLEEDLYESLTGTPYDLLYYIANKFNFKLAQSESEIRALTNGNKLLSVDVERVDTYRTLLSFIGLATCTFACFDRNGQLKLVSYANIESKTIVAKQRTTSSFSDFETYYTSVKASFLVDGAYTPYLKAQEGSTGLLYDLGSVPIIQGLPSENQAALDAIFASLTPIKYTPCDITFNGDPSVDLGDKIINIDREGHQFTSLVTFYKWTYRGRHQIKSAGANPKLTANKDKSAKEIETLQAQVANKTVPVYTFTNVSKHEIEQELEIIATLRFSSSSVTSAIFMATVNFSLDVDGVVEFGLYMDGVFLDGSKVVQYCNKGPNSVTMVNYLACDKGARYILTLQAKTYFEESDLRTQAAKIATNEKANQAIVTSYESLVATLKSASSVPITTLPATITYDTVLPSYEQPMMTINKDSIKAIVFAQGLDAKQAWDGTITVVDESVRLDIASVKPLSLLKSSDTLSVIPQVPVGGTFVESSMRFTIANPTMVSLLNPRDVVVCGEVFKDYTFETAKESAYAYGREHVIIEDNAFKLKTVYVSHGTATEIDEGSLKVVQLNTIDKSRIESVVVE